MFFHSLQRVIKPKKFYLNKSKTAIVKGYPSIVKREGHKIVKYSIELNTTKELELKDAVLKDYGSKDKYVIALAIKETPNKLTILSVGDITKIITEAQILKKMDTKLAKLKLLFITVLHSLRQIIADKFEQFLKQLETEPERINISDYYHDVENDIKKLISEKDIDELEELKELLGNAEKGNQTAVRDGARANTNPE